MLTAHYQATDMESLLDLPTEVNLLILAIFESVLIIQNAGFCRNVQLEMVNSDLELLLGKLARFNLRSIRLCGIHLNEGNPAHTTDVLRLRKNDSKDCNLDFSSLGDG